MAQIVGNLVVELSFDGSKFTQGLTQAKRELASYGKSMQTSLNVAKDENYSLDTTTKALNNMKVTYQALNGTRQQAITEMQKLESQGKQNSSTYARLKSDVSNYESQMVQLNKQYTDTQRKMYVNNSVFTKLGNGLTSVGQGMVNTGNLIDNVGQGITRVGIMATAAGAAFVNQAIEYERGMIQVQKTTNASDEQIAEFSNQIKAMANVMPVGVFELQNLAAIAGQLGIKQKDLAFFTETMAKIGTATTLSSEQASESLARFTNVSGSGVETLNNLGSSLVALGNNLATTETEIMDMAGLLVGTLTTLGVSEADILGISGAMSSLGITAERGGSSISKFFVDLAVAASEGGEDLEQFANVAGMSSDKFATLFQTDSMGAFTSFIDGLRDIKDSGGDVVKTLDDLGINEIRLRDTILKLVNGNDILHKSLQLSNEEFQKGTALQQEYDQQLKSTASQWEIAKNKIALVGIQLGDALLPAINDLLNNADGLIDMAKGFADWFTGLDEGIKRNLVSIAAFSPLIGAVVSGFGTLIKLGGGVLQFFGGVNKALGLMEGAYKAWKAGDIVGHVTSLGSKFALLNPKVLAVVGSIGLLYGAYKLLAENAIQAHNRMLEFPDISGITETQAESLRSMSDDLLTINTEMSMLGEGADVSAIATGMGDLATEIDRLNTEKIANLREDFSKLPTDVQETLKDSLEQTIANIEEQTTRVEEIMNRMNELTKTTYDENGSLLESHMLEMQLLTDEMMGYYAQALAENADQYVQIHDFLTRSITDMSEKQLFERGEYLSRALDKELELYKEQKDNLFNLKKELNVSDEDYFQAQEQLQIAHNTRIMALNTELAKTELELHKDRMSKTGQVLDKNHEQWEEHLRDIGNKYGLSLEQMESIALATDLSAPFQKMSEEVKRAYTELITAKNTMAEQLGISPDDIGLEHVEQFIDYAKKAGLTWQELELLSKDANIDDNTREFIEAVLDVYSQWVGLTFEEKIAKLKTEGKEGLKSFVQDLEMWNLLTPEQQIAVLQTIEQGGNLSDKILELGTWNNLSLEEKLAIISTEGYTDLEALLEDARVFDNLPPNITKEAVLRAIDEGSLTLETFLQTWQGTEFQEKMATIKGQADAENVLGAFLTFWLLSVLGLQDKTAKIDVEENATEPTQDAINILNEYGELAPNPELNVTDSASDTVSSVQKEVDYLGNSKPNTVLAANNQASPIINTVQGSVDRLGASRPTPTASLIDLASGVIASISGSLWNLNGRRADTYVYTHHITTTSTRRLATGTSKHYGGLAVLGDGGKREPFLTPSGFFGVSPDTDTLYNLPIGTKVWPSINRFKADAQNNNALQRFMKLLPHFKDGTDQSFLNTIKLPFKASEMDNSRSVGDTLNFNIELSVNGNSLSRSQADNIIEPIIQAAERYSRRKRTKVRIGGIS